MQRQSSNAKTKSWHDWTQSEVTALFAQPFNDLIFQAQKVHRQHFKANELQMSQLLSIKTGGCPEDCGYCSQSAGYDTGVKATKLMTVDMVAHSGEGDR